MTLADRISCVTTAPSSTFHGRYEPGEQVVAVPRPRVRLRMVLDREDRQLPVTEPFHGAVVQVEVRDLQAALLQAGGVHRVAVVLAGDVDPARLEVLHRVVAAAVA